MGRVGLCERTVVIAEAGENALRRLAQDLGCETLDHHPGIGGRYSVLSAVGLLPALLAGLDAAAVRAGAKAALDEALTAGADASPPAVGAALSVGLARHRGAHIDVMMPLIGSASCRERV